MNIVKDIGNYDGQQIQMAIPVHSQFDAGCFWSSSPEIPRFCGLAHLETISCMTNH